MIEILRNISMASGGGGWGWGGEGGLAGPGGTRHGFDL